MKKDGICERLGVIPTPPLPNTKLGLALSSLGKVPVHGLRLAPTDSTNGWYIWCGEMSQADDFFAPLHVEHLADYLAVTVPYLDLPPGYRFMVDDAGYEDVWFDAALLNS